MKTNSLILIITALAAALQAASAADITGKITLKGTAPAPADWTAQITDPNCGRKEPLLSRVYVAGKNGELAGVVVYIKDGLTGKTFEPSATPVVIDQAGCEYSPYISAVQVKQKLLVKNSDKTMHNINVQSKESGNPVSNMAQIMGSKPLEYAFAKPEEFAPFACNVHPWMKAYVSAFDHPFFAVTGADGTFKIANVPPGKYVIEANHRKAGKVTQEVTVGAENKTADFTLEVK